MAAPPVALPVEIFLDYHCPYSRRAVAWLDELGPEQVTVRHRFFALEQINHDPDAVTWRLWEQQLDYAHYRERPWRRTLAAFLATALLEAAGPPEIVDRFRHALYAARFDERADISDMAVLTAAAEIAGAGAGDVLERGFANPAAVDAARGRIADDWAAAQAPWRVFGVPTLTIGVAPPVYLRLAGPVPAEDGPRLLDALLNLREVAPGLLELKRPEFAETA
jgi:hypothetical protein